MKSFLNYLTQTFGFSDFADFSQSFIHFKFLLLTMPSALIIGGFFERMLGITQAMIISFIVLAILEIVTGLSAARAKGIKWESKKFSRFGLKIFVWLCLMFVANSFAVGYAGTVGVLNYLAGNMFAYLHAVLVTYVCFEYLISVIENLSVLTGQSNNKLIGFFKRKFNRFLGESEDVQPNTNEDTEKLNK
jgi:hypothetical protein